MLDLKTNMRPVATAASQTIGQLLFPVLLLITTIRVFVPFSPAMPAKALTHHGHLG
jgi:hypothetical protein